MSEENIKVFISYSWDSEEHKEWVLSFADRLVADGVDVILDRYEMELGRNLFAFADMAVAEAKKIIIIFTPKYKEKAESRKNMAGYEYSVIQMGIINNIAKQDKLIPLLRNGNADEGIPLFLQQFLHIDFTDHDQFEKRYDTLLRSIYGHPYVRKDKIGTKPDMPVRSPRPHGRIDFPGNDTSVTERRLPPKKESYFSRRKTISITAGGLVVAALVAYNSCRHNTQAPFSTPVDTASTVTHTGKQVEPDSNRVAVSPPAESGTGVTGEKAKSSSFSVKKNNRISEIPHLKTNDAGLYGFVVGGHDIKSSGQVVYQYELAEEFSEGLAKVMKGAKYGFINTKGDVVIPMIYDNAESFVGGRAEVRIDGHWEKIDHTGNCLEGCIGGE